MFGDQYNLDNNREKYQDERTTFNPQSPYAIAKLAGHSAVSLYRRSYDLFACGGILFNHESERRGERFVTRKISRYVADLYWATQTGRSIPRLKLGNLSAQRDWGHAEDYVEAMWMMLQHDYADDFVISTGNTYSVEDYLKEAFKCINIVEYMDHVEIDESLMRPSEVPYLRGISKKAERRLGWKPKMGFENLVSRMVQYDIQNNDVYKKDHTTT
jgi:GDPmannose 4,6-dehydratase